MSKQHRISVDIKASPSRLWFLLREVEGQAQWNSIFRPMPAIDGIGGAASENLQWYSGFRSPVQLVTTQKREIADCEWSRSAHGGRYSGVKVQVSFELLVKNATKTRVTARVSLSGWQVWQPFGARQRVLQNALRESLCQLKEVAERSPEFTVFGVDAEIQNELRKLRSSASTLKAA